MMVSDRKIQFFNPVVLVWIIGVGIVLAGCSSTPPPDNSNPQSTEYVASLENLAEQPQETELGLHYTKPIQSDDPTAEDSGSVSSVQPESQGIEELDNLKEEIAAVENAAQTKEISKKQAVKELNQKIQLESFAIGASNTTKPGISREGYRVGPGDVLEIAVFQVEELNRKVRITGDGMIMIPLLGGVSVNGMTTTEVEKLLTEQLGKDYLHDPQVSVFID